MPLNSEHKFALEEWGEHKATKMEDPLIPLSALFCPPVYVMWL